MSWAHVLTVTHRVSVDELLDIHWCVGASSRASYVYLLPAPCPVMSHTSLEIEHRGQMGPTETGKGSTSGLVFIFICFPETSC